MFDSPEPLDAPPIPLALWPVSWCLGSLGQAHPGGGPAEPDQAPGQTPRPREMPPGSIFRSANATRPAPSKDRVQPPFAHNPSVPSARRWAEFI